MLQLPAKVEDRQEMGSEYSKLRAKLLLTVG
jgi:hypothetical protein